MEKTGFVKFAYEKARSNYSYVWKLEHNVSLLKEWALLVGQDILESETITFDTGILEKTKHSMKAYFIISTGELIVKLRLGTPTLFGQCTHSKISVQCVYLTIVDLDEYCAYNRYFTKAKKEKLEEFSVQNTFVEPGVIETVWYRQMFAEHDSYSTIKISFTLDNVYWSDAINTQIPGEESTLSNELMLWSTLDTKTLFHSKQLTDFVIHCGDSKFQVHKIVLASRSPVFAAMFEQPLAETLEGKMTISDFEPNFIEEFLKFLYTGNADLENCAPELLLVAEKYCVDHLKQLSEEHLINSVSVDNVLDLHNLGKLANSEKLANKCMETLKRNKREMFKTADDLIVFLRDFSCAYEVVFE